MNMINKFGNGTLLTLYFFHIALKIAEYFIFFLCSFCSKGELVGDEGRLGGGSISAALRDMVERRFFF